MKSKPYFESFLRALGLTRDDVWATNVVKCIDFGVGHGDPEKCIDFLREELEIINPKYVILFGIEAAKWVLGAKPAYADGRKVVKDDRVYFVVPHPMTCVYGGLPAFKKFMEIANKVKKEMQISLERWL